MSARTAARERADAPSPRAPLVVPLVTVLLTGAACAWAVLVAPEDRRALVALAGFALAVIVCAAVTAAVYAFRQTALLRLRVAALEEEAARTEAEALRLADETLPAVVKRLRDGASAETALASVVLPGYAPYRRTLRLLAEEIGRGERLRAAAMSVCANAAGRVQALATSMMADLREMQQRHGEEVLGDLLRLDHSTAQAGRLADSIAVLTGARSGRRWTKPIVMESILRGAVGRISAYQRVRVHSSCTAAVAGHAAEGVMHALAELMDNATSFSPPSEEVHVYVEERSAGIVVNIEDGGLVMSEHALRRAERAVSAEPLDLTTLSGTRMGLPVVGALARKHGLTVSFRPSSRGGTGVVVMIPQSLLTHPRQDSAAVISTGSRPAVRPAAARAVSGPSRPEPTRTTGTGTAPERPASATPEEPAPARAPRAEVSSAGLPKRPRGRTLASAPQPEPAPGPAPRPAPAPRRDAGARFGAFRQAVQGAQAAAQGSPAAPEEGTGEQPATP